ncbi:MAG: tRNA lysidine(34) synthetase TilS [Clostridiaceae bacterium]|nr:tRNA lysidine(34) synthetase TilS [Clostridiaceae bacterium]
MRNQSKFEINEDIIRKGGRILVALSGGADSVCLLHFLASNRQRIGIEVMAAHFIHGIRPEAAEDELELVSSLCGSMGVKLFVGRGDTPAYSEMHKIGLEAAARELRYAYLYKTMEQEGCDAIATAHNLSDNSETMIFNLARGSGLSGLCGIPPVNDKVIRPLMGVSRQRIEEYDKENRLLYATDKTNFDCKYSRNRIRHNIMPQLRNINPEADKAMLRAAESVRQAEDFLRFSALGVLNGERIKGEISLEKLRKAHPALYVYILRELLSEAGGDPMGLNFEHVASLSALAREGKVSSSADIGAGFIGIISYDTLAITKREEPDRDPPLNTSIPNGQKIIWGGWEIEAGGAEGVAFCREQIEFPLKVRSRLEGDMISMVSGHKSVKKYLIDKKIPAKTRDRIPLICDNKGVLLLGDLEKDRQRCYKNIGVPFNIKCRRINI